MLHLLYGPAASGKTDLLMGRIRTAVAARTPGQVLLVPEQYSHEAERALCAACGDSLSLYAEVLSFTGLARRIAAETGAGDAPLLDQGGRLLCMALALDQVAPRLRLFGAAARRAQMQQTLLGAVDELKTACVTPDALEATAARCPGYLGDKLRDLALVLAAYDAVTAQGHADPTDRLTHLAERIPESTLGHTGQFYLDGFTDYTRQELAVVRALLTAGADVTVCLTLDALTDGNEIFGTARHTARVLLDMADDCGVQSTVEACPARAADTPLRVLEQQLFSYTSAHFDDPAHTISVRTADDLTAECAWAASRALQLVQSGCRWRDIAIAARGFSDYAPALERMCAYYGVPLYFARRTDLMQKPLVALIRAAYDIVTGGWDAEDVSAYLRTGLAGLTPEETDTLENYVLLWSLRGTAWTRAEPWRQHPDGFGGKITPESDALLAKIDTLRRSVAAPLAAFERRGKEATDARGQCAALAAFWEDISLPEHLEERSLALEEAGELQAAAEYRQLWELIVSALEQCEAILGDMPLSQEDFGRLFRRMLSQYDVGTIPVALDRVTAGDFDRMRRRSIRHLLVLGASDERLPRVSDGGGVFTDTERSELRALDIELSGGDDELDREFNLIYNVFTLPKSSLYVSRSAFASGESETRPSFVTDRIAKLFALCEENGDVHAARAQSLSGALELACAGDAAAREFFAARGESGRIAAIEKAAAEERGRLSREGVRAIYGQKLYLTASRIDNFASCRFQFFLRYGLCAKPRQSAQFAPPERGTFLHFLLENVAREVSERGGFAETDDKTVAALTDKYVREYVRTQLEDFREKSPRFVYLFRRLAETSRRIVLDTAQELRRSDFRPLDFELNFSNKDDADLPPVSVGSGEDEFVLTGTADRVDGWEHGGKLYIRIVDYKSGKKKFALSDVWQGMGLQMLLYLFTLEKHGAERYGKEIVPAGVLYVPAHDILVRADKRLSDEEIVAEKARKLHRSGLILSETEVVEAMEHGEALQFLPLYRGKLAAESLATAEQLGKLSRFLEETLSNMAGELRGGSIAADPWYENDRANTCRTCDYCDACRFSETTDGWRFKTKFKAPEFWEKLENGEEETACP